VLIFDFLVSFTFSHSTPNHLVLQHISADKFVFTVIYGTDFPADEVI
jgi:hypothetical protein